ncbi:MAG: class I SAM-dependent methyltransferase [Acidimicrobiia bacterium]
MAVIPFYGGSHPDLFALERRAMDRAGRVIDHLDRHLPGGRVLDVGAGNGHTAAALTTSDRLVVGLEPDLRMIDPSVGIPWAAGDAAALPFADDAFDAVYATWAYFFPGFWDIRPGLTEAERVTRPGGSIVVVDNLGDDEFCALSSDDIAADADWWAAAGFEVAVVETAFEFDDLADARRLLGWFFGDRGRDGAARRVRFRVGVFSRVV